jgi:hypothetical protein
MKSALISENGTPTMGKNSYEKGDHPSLPTLENAVRQFPLTGPALLRKQTEQKSSRGKRIRHNSPQQRLRGYQTT